MQIDMNWVQIVLALVVGVVTYILGYKNTIAVTVSEAISKAEIDYQNIEKAGQLKMIAAIKMVRDRIPAMFRPFFTDAWIENLVQSTFDATKDFVKVQVDKVIKDITKSEEQPTDGTVE